MSRSVPNAYPSRVDCRTPGTHPTRPNRREVQTGVISRSRDGWRMVVPVAFLVVALAAPAVAYHWHNGGWRDNHYNYPPKPSGYSQIQNVFGQPCSDRSYANSFVWKA